MKIHGIQKLTLLDYPGKAACTLFTAGCNFRCPFCHNKGLVTEIDPSERISESEIFSFLKKRQGLLDGVCISGGEPLLQEGLKEFIQAVKELGYEVKLDTNGSFPKELKELVDLKLLDYVAMDIKNSLGKYGRTIGVPGYDTSAVEQSVAYLKTGAVPYEFRTTVVREFHQKSDFVKIGEWLAGSGNYYLQKFEDSGNLIATGLHSYQDEIMHQALAAVRDFVPEAQIRGI